MPNRILRDWTDSERVDSLSWQAEVLFTRLIMKADDWGRYTAHPKLLKASLFPLKDGVREPDISRWLAECEAAGMIRLYHDGDGCGQKSFLEILKWRQQVRAAASRYPDPPAPGTGQPVARHVRSTCTADAEHMHTKTESETKTETEAQQTARREQAHARMHGKDIADALHNMPRPPPEIDTPEVRKAWDDWLRHLDSVMPRVSVQMLHRHMALLQQIGPVRAVVAIETAIARGLKCPAEPRPEPGQATADGLVSGRL